MFNTFNMGVGMTVVVAETADADRAIAAAAAAALMSSARSSPAAKR